MLLDSCTAVTKSFENVLESIIRETDYDGDLIIASDGENAEELLKSTGGGPHSEEADKSSKKSKERKQIFVRMNKKRLLKI